MNTLDEIKEQRIYWKPVRDNKGNILHVEGPCTSYHPLSPEDHASLDEIFPKPQKDGLPFKIFAASTLIMILVGLFVATVKKDQSDIKKVENALNLYKITKEVNASDYGKSYWNIAEKFYPQSFNREIETRHLMNLNGAKSPALHNDDKVIVPVYTNQNER